MKKHFIILLIFLFALTTNAQVHVSGYTRSNGTYVAPHMRSSPNSTPTDNYSYPGNTNPYTGKTATGNPDTYLKNYDSSNDTKTTIGTSDAYLNNNYYVSSNSLNVRSGPSTKYSVITSLGYGENLEVIESINQNWKKVRVSYYDLDSYSTKSKIGYVYSSHIKSLNSNVNLDSSISKIELDESKILVKDFIKVYNSTYTNSSNPPIISRPTNKSGKISLWTDCPNDGKISVYIDGIYKGQITSYFEENSIPNCGDEGTLNLTLSEGIHKLTASGTARKWDDYITIKADEWKINKLSKK